MLDPLNGPQFNECTDIFAFNPNTSKYEGHLGFEECGFQPTATDYHISWEGSLLSANAQVKETYQITLHLGTGS